MKNLIIAGLVAFASNAALAEPFEFQKRIGGPEYDFSDGTEHMSFAPVVASGSTKKSNGSTTASSAMMSTVTCSRLAGAMKNTLACQLPNGSCCQCSRWSFGSTSRL